MNQYIHAYHSATRRAFLLNVSELEDETEELFKLYCPTEELHLSPLYYFEKISENNLSKQNQS